MVHSDIYRQRRKARQMVFPEISAGFGVWRFVVGLIDRIRHSHKLELIQRVELNSQGYACAGEIHYELKNTGNSTIFGAVIDLSVVRPKDIYPDYGLFFDKGVGALEAAPRIGFFPTSKDLGAKHYRYRLDPSIFLSPGQPPLPVIKFILVVSEDTPPEDLSHEVEWVVSFPGGRSISGRVVLDGAYLKQLTLDNMQSKGRPPK